MGDPRPPDAPPLRSLFGDDAPKPMPPEPRLPTRSQAGMKVFTRVVLPAVVLIAGIACIAWVAQNLPGRGRSLPTGKGKTVAAEALQFSPARFVWDPKDESYIPDFELGTDGFFDYRFVNNNADEVEIGLLNQSCTCFGVDVCVFASSAEREEYLKDKESPKLTWTRLEVDKDLRHKATVPSKATGVLRIAWRGPKNEPELLRLGTKLWTRAGPGQDRLTKDLIVLLNYGRAAKFLPDKIDMGTLSPKDERSASFLCWSATRDLDVQPAGTDKLIQVTTKKLDAVECKKLTDEMRLHKEFTRVRSAYKITMTLFEERDGQQLDLGYLMKKIPLVIKGDGQPLEVPLPTLRATVLGDVSLGSGEEGGRIDLKFFPAKLGTTKKVMLLAPEGAKLSFVGCDPILLDLDVELQPVKTVVGKAQWQMEVTAKPNLDPGLLPENGVVVLRCQLPAVGTAPSVTRLVRIPVIGTAERSH